MEYLLKWVLIFFLFSCFSCNTDEERHFKKLRKEVLTYYKNTPDTLKLKASMFLLENVRGKYSLIGDRYEKYTDTINSYHLDATGLHQKLMILKNVNYPDSIVYDVNSLYSKNYKEKCIGSGHGKAKEPHILLPLPTG